MCLDRKAKALAYKRLFRVRVRLPLLNPKDNICMECTLVDWYRWRRSIAIRVLKLIMC